MNHRYSHLHDEIIVVKVGSESADFESNEEALSRLVGDVAYLTRLIEMRVLIVTSWAVEYGRRQVFPNISRDNLLLDQKQISAMVGNPILMNHWKRLFGVHAMQVGEWLVTHGMIENNSYGSQDSVLNGIRSSWKYGIVPVINENDFATPEELKAMGKGADNDKNALLLANLIRAKHIAIMTTTNGVYANPSDPSTRIPLLRADELSDQRIKEICSGKSKKWTGGMRSKLTVARDAANLGMDTYIFDGTESTLCQHILDGAPSGGTMILPAHRVSPR